MGSGFSDQGLNFNAAAQRNIWLEAEGDWLSEYFRILLIVFPIANRFAPMFVALCSLTRVRHLPRNGWCARLRELGDDGRCAMAVLAIARGLRQYVLALVCALAAQSWQCYNPRHSFVPSSFAGQFRALPIDRHLAR